MLVFWYPGVNPYLVERFNALQAAGTVPFHYVSTRGVDRERSWGGDIPSIDFPLTELREGFRSMAAPADLLKVQGLIKSLECTTLVSLHGYPETMASALVPLLVRNVSLYYYVEMTFDSWIRRTRVKELGKRLIFRRAKGVMAPGPDGCAYARSYNEQMSCHRLRHAIPDVFRPMGTRPVRTSSPRRFVYLGRPIADKGIHELFEAWETLRRDGPPATLQLVGGELPVKLADRAGALGITVKSYVSRADVPALLRGADCLVFPSRGDPYGLVIDEALACGVPVISSSSVGEVRGRVKNGVNGLIVQAGTGFVQGLTEALMSVCDCTTYTRLVRGARSTRVARLDDWLRDIESFWRTTRTLG